MVERGGNNKGEIVQMFQKAVDDKAVGEPWCMSFVQFCVNQVISLAQELNLRVTSALPESEHCMTVWRLSPTQHKLFEPRPGYLVIWRLKTSHSGHTGVVVEIEKNAIWTVEGNTSPDDGGDQREGDGVFLKKRPRGGFGNFHEVGFIDPFS